MCAKKIQVGLSMIYHELLVTEPRALAVDTTPKTFSCADGLLILGLVLCCIENWYKNSAGIRYAQVSTNRGFIRRGNRNT